MIEPPNERSQAKAMEFAEANQPRGAPTEILGHAPTVSAASPAQSTDDEDIIAIAAAYLLLTDG